MKPLKKYTERVVSKGDRLNWVPLQNVKPVVLNDALIQGRKLSTSNTSKGTSNYNLFVP